MINMNKFLMFLKKLFFLPVIPTIIISLPSFAFVIFTLINPNNAVVSYASYVMSAYALIISVTAIIRFSKPAKQKIKANRYYKKYFQDIVLRTKLFLNLGIIINMLYVFIKFFYGIKYNSFWFVSIAIYYLLLTLMRCFLLRSVSTDDKIKQIKRMSLVGFMLLLVNSVLALLVFFMVYWSRSYSYDGLLIYAMSAYTFYSVTISIVNIIKYRKQSSPALFSVKVVNLTSALVSLLTLETAMLTTFGGNENPVFQKIMISLTGLGVYIAVLIMAIYMIKYARGLIKYNNL